MPKTQHETFDHAISSQALLEMFGVETPPVFFSEYFQRTDTAWRYPTPLEERAYVMSILERMLRSRKSTDRDANYQAFNEGWRENLDRAVSQDISLDVVKPGYYRGVRYLLFCNELIIPRNPDLNYDLAILSATLMFAKNLSSYSTIYEFGCGSGLNLFLLHRLFPNKKLVGLDWCDTSVDIIRLLNRKLSPRIYGQRFDLLAPPSDFPIDDNSAFLTYTALEQIGTAFHPFCDFIFRCRPAAVLSWEPFTEAYDPQFYWQLLAHNYCLARGYLKGFYSHLQELSATGRIKILLDNCPGPGGEYYQPNLLFWTIP